MRILSHKKKSAFYKAFEGTEQQVLTENEEENGFRFGFTQNYIKVRLKALDFAANEITTVQLGEASGAEHVGILEPILS